MQMQIDVSFFNTEYVTLQLVFGKKRFFSFKVHYVCFFGYKIVIF